MEPKKPQHPNPFAAAFLERLQDRPEAEQFVLGGYFALKHYLDYRETADVDAWWRSRQDPLALQAAREAFAAAAAEFGFTVQERAWGETVSIEALDGENKVFSFQVAVRSVELDAPIASPWGRFPIETLDDNVASKMQALVARGAPRDFVDVKAIVDAKLVSVAQCWQLWVSKNPGVDVESARIRIQTNLARIEARMPIERLPPERRFVALALREWYREVFAVASTVSRGELRRDGEDQ